MSASVTSYAVDPDDLWRAFGSSDQSLLARVLTSQKKRIAVLAEDFEEKATSPTSMLRDFVIGTPPNPAWVHHNLLVIEILCAGLGKTLPARAWDRVSADLVTAVQAALDAGAVPLRLEEAFWAGPPTGIPTRNPDQPRLGGQCGFLGATQVAAIAAPLRALIPPDDTPVDVAAAIDELRRWVDAATELSTGLACFYR